MRPCHVWENCRRPEGDGVRFAPGKREVYFAMCHSLVVETVGGVTRTLRHGEPDQVVADLTAYYRSTPPARPLQLGGMERRRPGQYAAGQVYNIYFREAAARPARAADAVRAVLSKGGACRAEEHTSELQSLMRTSYAGFRLKQTKTTKHAQLTHTNT